MFNVELELYGLTQQYLYAYVNLSKALGGGWVIKEEMEKAKDKRIRIGRTTVSPVLLTTGFHPGGDGLEIATHNKQYIISSVLKHRNRGIIPWQTR